MKTIAYRGGVVTFRIPSHWREQYSETDGGMFYEARPRSGTLRLTMLTLRVPKELQSDSALDVLQSVIRALQSEGAEGTTTVRKDGNVIFKYEEATSERGESLTIFFWIVANAMPPRHARVATFSYTVLTKQRSRLRAQRDLKMLDAEIEAAAFSPELGVVAG